MLTQARKYQNVGSGLKQNDFVTSYLTYRKTKQREIKGEREKYKDKIITLGTFYFILFF